MAVHVRWPLTTGVAQCRYYCSLKLVSSLKLVYSKQPILGLMQEFCWRMRRGGGGGGAIVSHVCTVCMNCISDPGIRWYSGSAGESHEAGRILGLLLSLGCPGQ